MNRKYLETHPFISFHVDLGRAPVPLWMNIGEAKSKCEHIAGVPLRPKVAQELHYVYLTKGVLGTTAIEGNTLTEAEVRQLLDGRLKLPPSKEYLAQEINNIVEACNDIKESLKNVGDERITASRLQKFNASILQNLPLDEGVIPGRFRTYSVVVGPYKGPPPEECEYLISELCKWIESESFSCPEGGNPIVYGLIKAIVFHIYLAWIHPFGDGNGRTARLVELQMLLAAGVSTPAAHLLSNHYNHTRKRYYQELDRASKSGGDIIPFLEYAVEGFVDGLKEQLGKIRDQQWLVAWTNYIHEKFVDVKKTVSSHRQRDLAIALSEQGETLQLSEIIQSSPRVAKLYARKTARTIQRDLVALERLGLIERTLLGVRAKKEAILAFLPHQVKLGPPIPQPELF